ncbi:hypothetical protein ILUMI_16487 [Ignelater luminosus]|uniref:Retroviral polymerase SH3-like domain-containing protein n=1 Tax=Ignelater luminosus TaxID=2038154 RepID=A0A8K0CQ88_IGNLU|nr:hypothetical protein ILUMI_16487 [Ignelater luminosus]
MVGYCNNGYKLWCPEERKMILGKDVIFDERRFSFETVTSEKWLNNKEIEEKNDEEVEENQETEERIFKNIDLKEMCVKNGEDEVEEDIESIREYKVESRLEDEVVKFGKGKREKQKPSYLNDYAVLALSAESFVNNVPTSYEEIETRQAKQEWFQAGKRILGS